MDNKSKSFFVTLPNRGLIHLEGEDRHSFLQNLITNDINHAKPGEALYTAMLSPQGKFLFDFFILVGEDFTLLDCEGGTRAQKLYKHLKLYKLRSKVQVSVEEENTVYALINTSTDTAIADPRHPGMGMRSFEKPDSVEEKPFETWDAHRIRLGIPDGSRDMLVDKDTALECNLDKVNGVSFNKGCYVGQEITSRMKLRNTVRKNLYPVGFTGEMLEPLTDIRSGDQLIGQMRSHCGSIGLALLKNDALPLPATTRRIGRRLHRSTTICSSSRISPALPSQPHNARRNTVICRLSADVSSSTWIV
mgnify:CR=1 FL=1